MSLVDPQALTDLETNIKDRGHLDREHLLEFLTLIDSNDAQQIISETRSWLEKMDADPNFDAVVFPKGDIDAIISDLDAYGRVQPDTLYEFKQKSNKQLSAS